MKKALGLLFLLSSFLVFGQSNNNGQLDAVSEFTSVTTVYVTMPDGIRLATDIYLPIISDSVVTEITVDDTAYVVQIIPKGTQIFVYDSLGGTSNTNQYQLPMVFTRTPYGKGEYDEIGIYLNVLGYAYALQDMRGRYESEGVYLPMYSDGWDKSAYHPNEKHPLDITNVSDPRNSIYHQDGRHSIDFLKDSLFKMYDLDGDGIGDVPYHPVSLFSVLVERVPESLMLYRSFLTQLLDKSEHVMPSVTPSALVDNEPLMNIPETNTAYHASR